MPSTPIYGLPYPALNESPNGPTQIEALAEAVETELDRIDDLITALDPIPILQRGSYSPAAIAVNASNSTGISFTGGLFSSAPFVAITTNASRLSIGVTSITTSGATVILSNWSDASASGITVQWLAIQLT